MLVSIIPAVGAIVAIGLALTQLLFLKRVLDAEDARIEKIRR